MSKNRTTCKDCKHFDADRDYCRLIALLVMDYTLACCQCEPKPKPKVKPQAKSAKGGMVKDEYWHYKDWMNAFQRKCWRLVCDLYSGPHHVRGKVEPYGKGIAVCVLDDLATYDADLLTKLVVLAHDRGIRAEITVATFGRLRLILHARSYRHSEHVWERHPTLEEHVQLIRRPSKDDMPDDFPAKGE